MKATLKTVCHRIFEIYTKNGIFRYIACSCTLWFSSAPKNTLFSRRPEVKAATHEWQTVGFIILICNVLSACMVKNVVPYGLVLMHAGSRSTTYTINSRQSIFLDGIQKPYSKSKTCISFVPIYCSCQERYPWQYLIDAISKQQLLLGYYKQTKLWWFVADTVSLEESMANGTFLLSISGQIEYINILAAAGTSWHCKYEFVTGPDWKIVSGLEAGVSQTANVVSNGENIVLNLPIEIVYKSTNPYGWPQIVLSAYMGVNLQGYGRIHIPLQPGLQKLNASLSKPQPSSLLGYMATFFGYQPELLQPKMLASTAGNNLIQMISTGEVNISVNIIFQGLHSLGYDFGNRNI